MAEKVYFDYINGYGYVRKNIVSGGKRKPKRLPLGKCERTDAKYRYDEWKEEHKPKNIPPMPKGTFEIIYADPPWKYDFSKSKSRSIETHYQTMELGDICDLFKKQPQCKIANNAILFLWATAPKIREALKVLDSWNFGYKTQAIWIKDKIGMGYYFRGQHEILLIGGIGKPLVPLPSNRQSSVIDSPRSEHSAKPEAFYDLIETMYPNRSYLELFARNTRDGWESWGNDI